MTTLTDPARELADICTALNTATHRQGDVVLAQKFDVETWSADFYQILFTIQSRIDELIEIVRDLDMDDDFKEEAVTHIEQIRMAFTQNGTANQWSHSVTNYLNPTNVGPLKMLSMQVRATHAYPKLTEAEQTELLGEVDLLLEWLGGHQLREHDFIRAALIDGIEQFRFRLHRLRWLGWGYTLASLREVIGAYLALEAGVSSAADAPDAAAMLAKVRATVVAVFEKAGLAKGAVELGAFGLKAYGAVSLYVAGKTGIAGLLTSATG